MILFLLIILVFISTSETLAPLG